MNPLTDSIFTITWLLLLVWAARSILRGWSKPVRDYNAGTWTTQVTKRVHPEMEGVEPGEELMGVTFEPRSCDIEDYNELQQRITELQTKLEDPWEDEDDDGDIPAVSRK